MPSVLRKLIGKIICSGGFSCRLGCFPRRGNRYEKLRSAKKREKKLMIKEGIEDLKGENSE